MDNHRREHVLTERIAQLVGEDEEQDEPGAGTTEEVGKRRHDIVRQEMHGCGDAEFAITDRRMSARSEP